MSDASDVLWSSETRSKPLVIGLTGSIAAGKSTIAAMLAELGAESIDADRVYHELLTPGGPLVQAIRDHFGPSIMGHDGSLDRAKLGQVVFNDPAAMRSLEQITHPAVVQEVRRRVSQSSAPVVVIEAIKLAQSALLEDIDVLWLIVADPETRMRRLMQRSELDQASAQARLQAAKVSLSTNVTADLTIDTTAGLESTRQAIERAWHQLDLTMATAR